MRPINITAQSFISRVEDCSCAWTTFLEESQDPPGGLAARKRLLAVAKVLIAVAMVTHHIRGKACGQQGYVCVAPRGVVDEVVMGGGADRRESSPNRNVRELRGPL